MGLTKRQEEILDFLKSSIALNRVAPTYDEIAAHFGLRSKATIFKHIHALERKGVLHTAYNKNQSIHLLTAFSPFQIDHFSVIAEEGTVVPNAGDSLKIYPPNIHHARYYRVDTDRFSSSGIFKGDMLEVIPVSEIVEGKTVLAQRGANDLIIGTYYLEEGGVIRIDLGKKGLISAYYEAGELIIIGLVSQLIRRYISQEQ